MCDIPFEYCAACVSILVYLYNGVEINLAFVHHHNELKCRLSALIKGIALLFQGEQTYCINHLGIIAIFYIVP